MGECRFVRGRQNHLGGSPGFEGFLPSWRAEAPSVARLQARKSPFEFGRGEIVAHRLGECQEFGRQQHTDGMRPRVFGARVAATIAKKAGHGRFGANFQFSAQHIFGPRLAYHAIGLCNLNHQNLLNGQELRVKAAGTLRGPACPN